MTQFQFNGHKYHVTKAYNGKDGCACGCRGNYVDGGKAMARRVAKVESFVGPVRPNAANYGDAASYSTVPFCGDRYFYVREGDRVTTVYFA